MALKQHYQEFIQEMETDAKELTEQNQIKSLEATKLALQRKLERNENETKEILDLLQQQRELLKNEQQQFEQLTKEIEEYKQVEESVDPR